MRINNSAIDWDSENVEIFPIGLVGIDYATFIAKIIPGTYLVGSIYGYGKPYQYASNAEIVGDYHRAEVLQTAIADEATNEFAKFHSFD